MFLGVIHSVEIHTYVLTWPSLQLEMDMAWLISELVIDSVQILRLYQPEMRDGG